MHVFARCREVRWTRGSTRLNTHAVGALLLTIACGTDGRIGEAPTVSDSAGIVIVTSTSPIDVIPDATRSGVLKSTFGGEDGYPLGNVTAALRMSDSRIVFVDMQAGEVKAFTPAQGVTTVASRGFGPGEVMFPVNLQRLAGDSILVYDRRLGRVTVFAPDGGMAYEHTIQNESGRRPLSVFRWNDSIFVALYPLYERARTVARSGTDELRTTPFAALLQDRSAVMADTIVILSSGSTSIEMEGTSLSPVWGLGVPFAVGAGALIYGSGDGYEYEVLNELGRPVRIHRLRLARRPVDRDSLSGMLSEDLRGLQMLGTMLADHPMLNAAFLPDSQPAFKSLRIYNGDQVWLGSAEAFQQPSASWQVVSPTGEWLATVHLPGGAFLLDVHQGHLVLGRTGAFDEQSIEVYAMDESWLPG